MQVPIRRYLGKFALVWSLAIWFPLAAAAQPVATEVLARFPHGSYLENMMAADDGSVFYTNYFARRIERWSPDGGSKTFRELDLLPVSLASFGEKLLVVAHAATFDKIATVSGANRLVVMGRDGQVERSWPVDGARFLNGIEPIGEGRFLVADSIVGAIWLIDAVRQTATVWLEHEFLRKLPASVGPNPGANGVHYRPDGWVYVSNSERKALYRVRITANFMPSGELEVVKDNLPGIDDFAFGPDGSVIMASHQHEILRLTAGGMVSIVSNDESIAGSTSVVAGKGSSTGWMFATGTGGLFEGGKGEAALVRFRLP